MDVRLTGDWDRANTILDPQRVRNILHRSAARVGNYGASEVKKGIQSGAPGGQKFAELSALTIERKGSSKPLIDHGDLIGSITYQVTNNEETVFIGVKKGTKHGEGDAIQIARVHEFGCTIEVTPKMRAFLHYEGIHLKASTTHIHIPARPFLRPVLQSDEFRRNIVDIYLRALRRAFF